MFQRLNTVTYPNGDMDFYVGGSMVHPGDVISIRFPDGHVVSSVPVLRDDLQKYKFFRIEPDFHGVPSIVYLRDLAKLGVEACRD
jgi:hypothetical protein